MDNIWSQYDYFSSSVYTLNKPEFLNIVKTVSEENLQIVKKEKQINEIYPVYHTNNFFNDERLTVFVQYVAQTSWNILSNQGYKMDDKNTHIMEMWAQYHYKYSSMEQHVHPYGSYITGFYILDVPKNSSQVVLHDPRPSKVQLDFGAHITERLSNSLNMIFFDLEPGTMMFTNSWLPHSFTRNQSDKPFSFVHFNLGISNYIPPPSAAAEVI